MFMAIHDASTVDVVVGVHAAMVRLGMFETSVDRHVITEATLSRCTLLVAIVLRGDVAIVLAVVMHSCLAAVVQTEEARVTMVVEDLTWTLEDIGIIVKILIISVMTLCVGGALALPTGLSATLNREAELPVQGAVIT